VKILFVYIGAENLGVEYLAAAARAAGHEVDLAFDPAIFGGHLVWNMPSLAKRFDLRPKIIERIRRERPDALAFSCFTGNYLWALSIAREAKKTNPSIINLFGGVHVTAVPERVISEDAVDAIALGEADTVFVGMCETAARQGGEIPAGVWIKSSGVVARGPAPKFPAVLDALPLPAKDLFYERVPAFQRYYMIKTARGCPYNCTYCYKSLSVFSPPGMNPIRRRSVGNVMGELEAAVKRWKVRMVVFRDDVFTLQKKWLREFTVEYRRRIGLPYFCLSHPAALDAESADMIKEGGCGCVTIGIQSADAELRRSVLNRNYTNEQVRSAVALLKERNIVVYADHIIGLPGDTPERLRAAIAFYNELRPERLLTYWLTYYPGTEIMEKVQKAGIITQADRDRIEGGQVGFMHSGGGPNRLNEALKRFPFFFALIPLLKPRWIRWLLNRNFEKICPASFAARNILIFLNAIRTRDPLFFDIIGFYFSRKRVP